MYFCLSFTHNNSRVSFPSQHTYLIQNNFTGKILHSVVQMNNTNISEIKQSK